MFWDENILKIVKRAGDLSELDTAQILQEYMGIITETMAIVAMDHEMEKTQKPLTSPKQVSEFIEELPQKIQADPELKKKIDQAILEADVELIKYFRKAANPGDIAYMQVYLKSKIKELDKKIKEFPTKKN